jgi:hypothetical protein
VAGELVAGLAINLLAGLRLGLKNRQVGEKWVYDDCSYLCKGLTADYCPHKHTNSNHQPPLLHQGFSQEHLS